MGPLDALNHLLNLFLVPVALGALAPALAKLLWRKELAGVGWLRMAVPASGACALVVIAGLVLFGRDGKMATYALLVLVVATVQWLLGRGWRS